MPQITPQAVAMGVGTAGAMVDVTAYLTGPEGVTWGWGRQDSFRVAQPGAFSFVLENQDGRFTPGNLLSPLATLVSEGMPVSWQLGTRIVSGVISSVGFAGDATDWGRITINCYDQLGVASRNSLMFLPDDINTAAGQLLMWRCDDAAGSTSAVEAAGRFTPLAPFEDPVVLTFGEPAPVGLGTQVLLNNVGSSPVLQALPANRTQLVYPQSTMGAWGFWYTYTAASTSLNLQLNIAGLTGNIQMWATPTNVQLYAGNSSGAVYTFPAPKAAGTYYVAFSTATTFSAGVWTITCTLWLNGVAVGSQVYAQTGGVTSLTNAQRQPVSVQLWGGIPCAETFSRLSHTVALAHEEYAQVLTEAGTISAAAATVPQINLAALPTALSTAPVGIESVSSKAALDLLNDVLLTEQGQIWTESTGTLLAPVQSVMVRERTRPPAVSYSFDAQLELAAVPQFLHDVTNMFSSVTATGPTNSGTASDPTVIPVVGNTVDSETVLLANVFDLTRWAEDRLNRGENVALRVASVTIDALTTPTDRSADLFNMNPGDRLRITNLDAASLGFSTWDGWLLGVSEQHPQGAAAAHIFQLFLEPCVHEAIFDTDRFSADGALSLSGSITSAATTMSVATSVPANGGVLATLLSTTETPYNLLIDREIVTVTAVTTATPQVATIVRAQNGTVAAAHSSGALMDITPLPLFAF